MKRILAALIVIGITSTAAVSLTRSYFSDTETSAGNVLSAGAIDLKIDNESYVTNPEGELVLNEGTSWALDDLTNQLFFNFTDIKPGDVGEDTISLHVDDNDAWACMEVTLTDNDDNTCTEPELIDDPNCTVNEDLQDGELAENLNFIFWHDDGDNVLETLEKVIASGSAQSILTDAQWVLADSSGDGLLSATPLTGAQTYYIGKAWCFGTIAEDRETQDGQGKTGTNGPLARGTGVTCDGSALDNATQSDIVKGDITFSAVQSRNNASFTCFPTVTPTPTATPTPVACVPGYATGVNKFAQGTRKDGTAVLADRSDPNDAVGAPQSTGTPSDTPVVAGSFYSLGFGANNVGGGSITLTFANPIVNLAGYDFRVFEVTGGVYPDEVIKVEASNDGTTFFLVGNGTRDAFFDLTPSGLASATYLRITDQSDKSLFEPTADAYDLDGVQTFCGTQPI